MTRALAVLALVTMGGKALAWQQQGVDNFFVNGEHVTSVSLPSDMECAKWTIKAEDSDKVMVDIAGEAVATLNRGETWTHEPAPECYPPKLDCRTGEACS